MAALVRAAVLALLALATAASAESPIRAHSHRRPTAPLEDAIPDRWMDRLLEPMRARASAPLPMQLLMVQADAQIAQHMRTRRQDPLQIARSVQGGVAAVMDAVKHFTAKPPRVQEGLHLLGTRLLEIVKEPVEKHFGDTDAYSTFEEGWMKFFDVASLVPQVTANITLFTKDGSPDAIVTALTNILSLLGDGVVEFVPKDTAEEIVKYVDTIGDVVESLGSSWKGFKEGDEVQAIQDLYSGIRAGLDGLLPEFLRNNEIYKQIIGSLDGVINSFTGTVQEFQRQIVEGKVCWKQWKSRPKIRPSVCPWEGFSWNEETLCLPDAPSPEEEEALLLEEAMHVESLDMATARKIDKSSRGKHKIPAGARVSVCEQNSNHSEKIGGWCYENCPGGMRPADLTRKRCKSDCSGEFPADDGKLLCGRNRGLITEATINMVIGPIKGIIKAGLLIAKLVLRGFDFKTLRSTIDAFVSIAKPFVHRKCPYDNR